MAISCHVSQYICAPFHSCQADVSIVLNLILLSLLINVGIHSYYVVLPPHGIGSDRSRIFLNVSVFARIACILMIILIINAPVLDPVLSDIMCFGQQFRSN